MTGPTGDQLRVGPDHRAEFSARAVVSSEWRAAIIAASLAGMALCRTDAADGAVAMLYVAPIDECAGPGPGFIEPGKAPGREFRAVFAQVAELPPGDGMKLSGGTIVDATLIAAPPPTKNQERNHDKIHPKVSIKAVQSVPDSAASQGVRKAREDVTESASSPAVFPMPPNAASGRS